MNQPALCRCVVFAGRPRINQHWVEVSCLLGGPESTSIGSRCRVCRDALNQPALGRGVVFAGRPWINQHWVEVSCLLGGPESTSIGSRCRVCWEALNKPALGRCVGGPESIRRFLHQVFIERWAFLSQRTRDTEPMSFSCWASLADGGQTLKQQWPSVSCFLG